MFDLPSLLNEIDAIAEAPPPLEFAQAALNDFLLSCKLTPLLNDEWQKLRLATVLSKHEEAILAIQKLQKPSTSNQICIFALWGLGTTLYARTRSALPRGRIENGSKVLDKLFVRLRGIPEDIMSRVRFRREEALRSWANAFEIPIVGENPDESRAKLARLDYFAVMQEAQAAESSDKTRKRKEALRRMAEEKQAAEAAARGNYE